MTVKRNATAQERYGRKEEEILKFLSRGVGSYPIVEGRGQTDKVTLKVDGTEIDGVF